MRDRFKKLNLHIYIWLLNHILVINAQSDKIKKKNQKSKLDIGHISTKGKHYSFVRIAFTTAPNMFYYFDFSPINFDIHFQCTGITDELVDNDKVHLTTS